VGVKLAVFYQPFEKQSVDCHEEGIERAHEGTCPDMSDYPHTMSEPCFTAFREGCKTCHDGDTFAKEVDDNGVAKKMTCRKLAKKDPDEIEEICKENVLHTEEYKAAQVICLETCNSCDICYENENTKVQIGKPNKPKYKTCKKLKKDSEKKIKKYCKKEGDNLYPSAMDGCPQTCKNYSCIDPPLCTDGDTFAKEVYDNGEAKKMTCSKLAKKDSGEIEEICKENTHQTEEYKAAQVTCKTTCNSCDMCYENENTKVQIGKPNKPKYTTCKKLKKESEKKIGKNCGKEGNDLYPSAMDGCPQTCEKGPC